MKLNNKILNWQNGAMMTELLLSIALAAAMLPFLLKMQKNSAQRAQDIAMATDIKLVQYSLEKYMDANKKILLATIGKNITRVKISDLAKFDLPDYLANNNKFNLRILKTPDMNGHTSLQGVVILNDDTYSAVRTRKIAEFVGANAGVVDEKNIHGAFGTWNITRGHLGGEIKTNASATSTRGVLKGLEYIWRKPSPDLSDATFASSLSLGGHNIIDADIINAKNIQLSETLASESIKSDKIIFNSRPTLDEKFVVSGESTVSGNLSSDSKNLEISNSLTISEIAKIYSLTAKDLFVNNLATNGIYTNGNTPEIKIGKIIDISGGKIVADIASIGFTGSITPRLYIASKIEDPTNSNYFWDATNSSAVLNDIELPLLNQLATVAVSETADKKTEAYKIMMTVASNTNATVSDYVNALDQIKTIVNTKYENLNLK